MVLLGRINIFKKNQQFASVQSVKYEVSMPIDPALRPANEFKMLALSWLEVRVSLTLEVDVVPGETMIEPPELPIPAPPIAIPLPELYELPPTAMASEPELPLEFIVRLPPPTATLPP